MWPDLELSKEAIKSLYRRSKSNEPKSVITQLPDLVRTATQIAIFKAGDPLLSPIPHKRAAQNMGVS
jgi:hypothetical protein